MRKKNSKMKKFHTVIFDLDGTLADTLGDLNGAVNAALMQHGFPERSLEETRAAIGNGIRNLIERSAPAGTDAVICDSLLKKFRAYYREHLLVRTVAYPGMVELLQTLRDAGVRIAVASNKFDAGTKEIFCGLFGDTAEVVRGETEDCPRKPAPDIIDRILTELGVPKEGTVLVGDSEVDIKTAQNAGIEVIGVTWGFRSPEQLLAAGAEKFADTAEEIRRLVL